MNFKDWEKLAEDDKSVKLRHPKGHEMTIALKALPKIQQEMVKRLKFAKGGDVLDSGEDGESEQGKTVRHANKTKADLKQAKEEAKGRAQMEKTVKPKLKGLAHGGVAHYYEGTDQPVSQQDEAPQPQAQPAASAQPPVVNNIVVPGAATPQAPPAPVVSPAAQLAKAPIDVQPPSVPMGESNVNPDGTMNPAAVARNAQQAVKSKSDIEASAAKASLPSDQAYLQQLGQQDQMAQDKLAEVTKRVDAFANYANSPETRLNPKHYQESMGSGQKVATALGLFMGGLGVPFGGQNYAMDFLNKQIDRDIDAQYKRSDQQKTILGAYQQIYGDGVAARAATKATMLDIRTAQAKQIADQLGTATARQRFLELGNAAAIEKSKLLQDAAVNLHNLPGTGSGQAPEASKKEDKGGTPKKHPLQGSLLHPGAEQAFQALQYTPKAKDQLPELTRQFTQAQQSDKALKQVNDTFMNLITESENGGVGGRIHRTMDPHALPGSGMVGDAVKAVGYLGQQISNTDVNRLYDSQQSELKGYISSALKGTNVGSADIDDIVSKNSPEYGDSRETQARKLKTIRDFIKNHTETSLLKTWHLTNE